jgi:hypothetical protein
MWRMSNAQALIFIAAVVVMVAAGDGRTIRSAAACPRGIATEHDAVSL